jgi:hypothetical protein
MKLKPRMMTLPFTKQKLAEFAGLWNVLQDLPRHARQLGDVYCDEERLVARRPIHRHLPLRLILEIEIGEHLAVSVLHDEGFRAFLEQTSNYALL